MKKAFLGWLVVFEAAVCIAQVPVDSIRVDDARQIITYLASDSLKGRKNFTAEQHQAARFIAQRFLEAGLTSFPSANGYYWSVVKDKRKTVKDAAGNYNAENTLLNVVGVLQGKTRPNEMVLFIAHYDNEGTEKDSVYNGANDNASGTTALLLLADYFAQKANNERTLLFCAFAGEKTGWEGSRTFANFLNPKVVVSVINIDMIGIPEFGKNNFFIGGEEYSDFKKIFQKNLTGPAKIVFEQSKHTSLFFRSSNIPFADKGIPAHTIMSSTDDDPCFYKPCDKLNRIDMEHLVNVTRAIALGSETIIQGIDTPKRIKGLSVRFINR